MFTNMVNDIGQGFGQSILFIRRQYPLRSGLPCGLGYRLVMACQGGEGRELGGTVYHRHRLPGLGNVVRQVDDVVISTHGVLLSAGCVPFGWPRPHSSIL